MGRKPEGRRIRTFFKHQTRHSVRFVMMVKHMLTLSIGSDGSNVALLHLSKHDAEVGCFILSDVSGILWRSAAESN